jgi:predicted metal-dependent phosphoesterase TrpH
MSSVYDLHSHSTASDGTLTPRALVQRAAVAQVRALALTDHDTTEGLEEAAHAAAGCALALIPGVELSVTWGGLTVHVVGLNLQPENAMLQQGLARLREFRDWRAGEIARRLAKKGIEGALEGATALSNGRLISRTHFARFLVQKGLAADEKAVFRHYLVKGKPGHVPGQWAGLDEALQWIHGAGGEAVIAHPARYRMTRSKLRRLIGEFKELGGAALEVVSGSHSRDDTFVMARHAADFGLRASAGSDFHTPANPWIDLGRLPPLPEGCIPIWREWETSRLTTLSVA